MADDKDEIKKAKGAKKCVTKKKNLSLKIIEIV